MFAKLEIAFASVDMGERGPVRSKLGRNQVGRLVLAEKKSGEERRVRESGF